MTKQKDVKMVCPKCKNDTFRLVSRLISLKRINAEALMWNSNEVCTKCGWRSKPDDVEEKRRRLLVTLELASYSPRNVPPKEKDFELFDRKQKELVDWEGFEIVEMKKNEKNEPSSNWQDNCDDFITQVELYRECEKQTGKMET